MVEIRDPPTSTLAEETLCTTDRMKGGYSKSVLDLRAVRYFDLKSMRVTDQEVQYLARKIIRTLTTASRIDCDSEAAVVTGLTGALLKEIRLEDALNEEARQILMSHSTTMARDNITGLDMFRKVKRELAKKKGIVL